MIEIGSGNWVVDNINSALGTWNDRLSEIWQLLSTSPENFKGGGVWDVIQTIHGALQAVGYACLLYTSGAGQKESSVHRGRHPGRYRGQPGRHRRGDVYKRQR